MTYLKIWKQSDPSEALITKNYKRITDSVWLSLYMRDNEYVQHPSRPLAPAWAVLKSQHLMVLASIIPKDQKNITTLKWSTGQLFTAATQHLTPADVKHKYLETKWSLGSINQYKITSELQTRFDWVCTWGIMNTCNIPHVP
jgi:hypothetical protein